MAHYELEKANYFWVDMSPEYIYYDQDINNGKMVFKFMMLDLVFKNMFMQTKIDKINSDKFPYIHVELFENLSKGYTNFNVHFYKENTYSLGLIILSLAMKFDFYVLYNDLLPINREGNSMIFYLSYRS
jgi:hypothetical protein